MKINRREFLKTSIAAGIFLSVSPVITSFIANDEYKIVIKNGKVILDGECNICSP